MKALILAGRVKVDSRVVDKAGTLVKGGSKIEVAEQSRYVGRGGEKLNIHGPIPPGPQNGLGLAASQGPMNPDENCLYRKRMTYNHRLGIGEVQ